MKEENASPASEPLSRMRRIIADRLQRSLQETAQLTITAEADVTALAEQLRHLSSRWGRRVSYTEAAMRACALALRSRPRLTASLENGARVYPQGIDVGVAVALDDGLVVPVIRDADHKSLETLGREIADVAARARGNCIGLEELEGGCISVSSLGAYRIDAFTPILNPPQPMILGLGRGRLRPSVVEDQIVPRMLMVLSLTVDHRLIDGAPAAEFLGEVVSLLEHPDLIHR